MTISELIEKLEACKKECGDVEVMHKNFYEYNGATFYYRREIKEVKVWELLQSGKEPVQILLLGDED